MIIALTGGSGVLGRHVARMLDRRDVVVLTRTPAGKQRFADFDDVDSLPAAFAGVDRLLLISTNVPDPARRAGQHKAAIDAAVSAGVGHVVYTSLVGCDGPPDLLHGTHRETEAHLRASGLAWTVLRNNIYAEGLIPPATGRYVTNAADGAVAYVARRDCAAAAAAVLNAPDDRHHGQVLDVTGPSALDAADVAATFSEVLGRRVEPVHLDDGRYLAHLVDAGTPEPLARALVLFGRTIRSGSYATTSGSVLELTGVAPTPVRVTLRR
ncbi:MAG: NAD(P)H-binding protein [Umezawaea sp.]